MKKTLLDLLRTGVVITIAGLAALSAPASSQEPEHEGEIEGVVRDAETGAPLAGALVSVIGTGTRAVTHGDGTFHLTGMASRQDQIGEFETPTGGYTVLNLSAGARVTLGGRLNVLTASLDNATDAEYRNHLSRVKGIMPEAGRGLSVTYRVVF